MNLEKLLKEASEAYYRGEPIISDEVFDRLSDICKFEQVGHKNLSNKTGKHLFRLYSLQKYYKEDGESPLHNVPTNEKITTPKLDGAVVSLLYINKVLSRALTRGDGIEGIDVTDKFLACRIVPHTISHCDSDVIQIDGEVVAPKEIPNARNYAAGALGLNDPQEFKTRALTFIAHGVHPAPTPAYDLDMKLLNRLGIKTVTDCLWEEYPQDGLVVRVISNDSFEKMGYTSKHPRGAYALKNKPEGAVTRIIDIIWQTGKSGKVTPVAIVEPVDIGGAVVTRATLNNPGFIEDMDIDVGNVVEIIRSGEIIPCIVRKIADD